MLHDERPVIEVDKEFAPGRGGRHPDPRAQSFAALSQIIAALKAHDLPIAGVDRSALTAPLAVQDLLSLLRFLATPEDDLSLAEVLRSPIGGWSDDDLFRLAHGRTGTCGGLAHRAEERPDWAATHAMLRDLRDQSDFKRPYDLLERALCGTMPPPPDRASGRRSGRRHRRDAGTGAWPMNGWRCRA
jgi:hypothetical protein